MLGRIKNAVSDVAETLRQAFTDPPCRSIQPAFPEPRWTAQPLPEAVAKQPDYSLEALPRQIPLSWAAPVLAEPMDFPVRSCSEEAWEHWVSGTQVFEMPIFRVRDAGRLTVPPLPRMAIPRRQNLKPMQTLGHSFQDPILPPRALQTDLGWPSVRAFNGLHVALGLPIAVPGEDFLGLSRALQMRYNLQMVRETGQNIRNLEVLGLYLIPAKGVLELRHDARTGRILLRLGPDAASAKRARFFLARRKDDRTLVSCFVEEG